jgi:hypothetical protein
MKSCIVYISTNCGFSDESIACGLIHINEDGSYLFKWSEEKLDIAVKLMKSENESSVKDLIKFVFDGIINNTEIPIMGWINYTKTHGTGLIKLGDVRPFIPQVGGGWEELELWYNKSI